ncbi:MAG: SPFH domain-containing protein [Verrucomicrobiota bacterium]|nr:SPFH domain-containing protein [Verrucomicrobiota bacterium]
MNEPENKSREPADLDLGAEAVSRAMDEALQSSFTILKLVIAVLVVYLIFSNTGTVEGKKEGVIILRFGKAREITPEDVFKSGIRFAWPYPLEERVTIERVRPITTKFFKYSPVGRIEIGDNLDNHPLDAEKDGYVLTRDGLILHLEATLNFVIKDPKAFAFNFAQPEKVLSTLFESAITHEAFEVTMADLYQSKLKDFITKVEKRTKKLVKNYGLGVTINRVYIRQGDVELPFMIRNAYKEKSSSSKKANEIKQQAKNSHNQVIESIKGDGSTNQTGEVAVILSQAKGQATTTMREVEALRQRFYSIYGGENENEQVRSSTERRHGIHRLYFEVFNRLMTESDLKIYVISNRNGPRQKVHLLINPKPPEPKKKLPFNSLSGQGQGPPPTPPGG